MPVFDMSLFYVVDTSQSHENKVKYISGPFGDYMDALLEKKLLERKHFKEGHYSIMDHIVMVRN